MTSSSSSSSNKSQIVAFGDINSYRLLFDEINKKYSTASNSLTINESNQLKNSFVIKIQTKYYNLNSNLIALSNLNEISDHDDLEGIFILMNNNDEISYFENDSIKKVFSENETCFKAILFNQTKSEEIEKILEPFEDIIQIDLKSNDDNDNEFNGLDEFVNSLFVHSWPNLKMKIENKKQDKSIDDKKEIEKTENSDVYNDSEEDHEENFNFEHMISNLAEMRAKASEMSFEERKLYAEDVVKKFWRSIGGNEEEISDLTQ